MEEYETYSTEIEIKKRKVKATLEFPCTVDPKDADRFEHMLKEIYMNQIQYIFSEKAYQTVAIQAPVRKGNEP